VTSPGDTQGLLLETIRGEPNSISSGQNEVFTRLLIGYRKCGKSFAEGGNKRAVKGQIRVVLRPVSLGSFTVKSKEDKRTPQPMTTKTTP